MNHCGGDIKKKEEAVQVCIDGLMDEDTHLSTSVLPIEVGHWSLLTTAFAVYRPRLSRRLKRLENQLSLPADERHICEAELRKSSQRVLKAHRVRAPPKNGQQRPAGTGGDEDEDGGVEGKQTSGKSWWTGREGEVGVEQWVLEWWENRGYKG
jgi:Fanconi-associated nuclease 1